MKTPMIKIHLEKVEHNVRTITTLCHSKGIQVAGVTKGTLGMPEVAEAMLRGGVQWLGDSRVDNIRKLKSAGIHAPCLMMRSPHLSEVKDIVATADISLHTDLTVLEAASEAALSLGKMHKVILMADLGDLREGFWPDEMLPAIEKVLKMKGLELIGLGANLTDLNGTIPSYDNNMVLVELAEAAEKKFSIKIPYLSAGNSSSLKLLASGNLPSRINHFRIGEALLLGRETVAREIWPDTWQDAFTLTTEVIESKRKPSVPIGELGQDAFGNTPKFEDKGWMTRSILNIGRQDMNPDGLIPRDPRLQILGATSDHLLIDSTNATDLKTGDLVEFDMSYGALLAAMTSPYVAKMCF